MSYKVPQGVSSDDVARLLVIAVFFLIVAFAIWISFFASCESIGWLPITSVPARCLQR